MKFNNSRLKFAVLRFVDLGMTKTLKMFGVFSPHLQYFSDKIIENFMILQILIEANEQNLKIGQNYR